MIFLVALIPATALTIAGYFVLYLSSHSEGAFRTGGKYLGYWAFTLAGLVILGGILAAAHGGHHAMFGPRSMEGRMHGRWSNEPHLRGPQAEGPSDSGRPDEAQQGALPEALPDASNPAPPQETREPASH
jgi:hypothetical protein